MDIQEYNDTSRLSVWQEMVRSCRNSGKTVGVWCQENNVNVKTYYYRLSYFLHIFIRIMITLFTFFSENLGYMYYSPSFSLYGNHVESYVHSIPLHFYLLLPVYFQHKSA